MRIVTKKIKSLSRYPEKESEVIYAITFMGTKHFRLLCKEVRNGKIESYEKCKDGSIELGLNDFDLGGIPFNFPVVLKNQIINAISKGAEVLKIRKK